MAIINNTAVQIKVHNDADTMLALAVGDLNRIYTVAPGGVFLEPFEPNTLHVIDVYQDTSNASLHGLFRKK